MRRHIGLMMKTDFYEEFSVKMEEVRKKLDGLKDFS